MVSVGVDAFAFLEDKTLAAVTFIWNYYQFLIGTETLSLYSDPIVVSGGITLSRNEPGYRNALCARIGQRVVRTASSEDHLELHFDDGVKVRISFRPEDRVAKELQESLVATNAEGNILVVGDSEAE